MDTRCKAPRKGIVSTPLGLMLALGLLSGCASSTLHLDSQPQKAEIYVSNGYTPGDSSAKKIGETPLSIKASEVEQAIGGSGPLYVEFRKERHTSARAVITDTQGSDIRLLLALPAENGLEDQDTVNSSVDLSFEAQRLTVAGRFDEALSKIKQAQKETPLLAAPFEIEAGIYYLQKRLPEALDAYRTAAKLNPRNPETLRMRKYLEASLQLGPEGTQRAPARSRQKPPA